MSTKLVEEFIKGLEWSNVVTDYQKTLIAGNIRHFAGFLAKEINELKESRNFPGTSGSDYDKGIQDVINLLVEFSA